MPAHRSETSQPCQTVGNLISHRIVSVGGFQSSLCIMPQLITLVNFVLALYGMQARAQGEITMV